MESFQSITKPLKTGIIPVLSYFMDPSALPVTALKDFFESCAFSAIPLVDDVANKSRISVIDENKQASVYKKYLMFWISISRN